MKKSNKSFIKNAYSITADDVHYFNVLLACKIGTHKAILMAHVVKWCKQNFAGQRNIFFTVPWTYNSAEELAKVFPYMSTSDSPESCRRAINRALEDLVNANLLIKANFNKAQYDKTNWYTANVFQYYSLIYGKEVTERQMKWWIDLKKAVEAGDESLMFDWTNCPIEWTNDDIRLDKSSYLIGQSVPPIPVNSIIYIKEVTDKIFCFFAENPDQKRAIIEYATYSEERHGSFDDEVKKYVAKNIENPMFKQDPLKNLTRGLSSWLLTAKSFAKPQKQFSGGQGLASAPVKVKKTANLFQEDQTI